MLSLELLLELGRWCCLHLHLQGQAGGSARWPPAFPGGFPATIAPSQLFNLLLTLRWAIHTDRDTLCSRLLPVSARPRWGSSRLLMRSLRSLFSTLSPPPSPNPTPPRLSSHSTRAAAGFDADAYSAMDSIFSYLRIPVLASTGLATVLSGVLYFKQKYACAQCAPRLMTQR